jgi:hypothetical protein
MNSRFGAVNTEEIDRRINRRIMFDAYFIFKVLSSFINSSDVVNLFKVHVPGRRVGGFSFAPYSISSHSIWVQFCDL